MPEDELRDAVLRMRATQQALPRPGTRRVHRQLGLRSAPRERFLRAPVPPVGTGLDAQSAPEPEVSRTLLPTVTLASPHGAEVPLWCECPSGPQRGPGCVTMLCVCTRSLQPLLFNVNSSCFQ